MRQARQPSRHRLLGMSLPLLFSFQLEAPPDSLQSLPFMLIYTWALVSVVTVPVLAGLEIVACVFHLRHRDQEQAALPFHATALVVAAVSDNRVHVREKKRTLSKANGFH